jgi:hypothetical protein
MTDKIWTRQELTEQILKDVAVLWQHCEQYPSFQSSADDAFAAVKGGAVALIEDRLGDTRDLLTFAVGTLHALRELILAEQTKRQTQRGEAS